MPPVLVPVPVARHHEQEDSDSPGTLVLIVIGLVIFHVGAFVSLKRGIIMLCKLT